VEPGSPFDREIEWLASEGITRGCNPPVNDQFCVDDSVTRGQMAAFVVRARELTGTGSADFSDIGSSVFETDIRVLANAGITAGCNPPTDDLFCPDDTVTRGQMAAFMVRAYGLTGMPAKMFVDTEASVFANDISLVAEAGITIGCNPPDNDRFCPDDPITRGQMAAFFYRARDLG
jgi:hypothetical protein